jgi:hypothetical protein
VVANGDLKRRLTVARAKAGPTTTAGRNNSPPSGGRRHGHRPAAAAPATTTSGRRRSRERAGNVLHFKRRRCGPSLDLGISRCELVGCQPETTRPVCLPAHADRPIGLARDVGVREPRRRHSSTTRVVSGQQAAPASRRRPVEVVAQLMASATAGLDCVGRLGRARQMATRWPYWACTVATLHLRPIVMIGAHHKRPRVGAARKPPPPPLPRGLHSAAQSWLAH